jgi:thiamine biosynthesis lipoprotein
MPSSLNSVIHLASSVAKVDRSTVVLRKPGHFQGVFHAMGSPCELLIETNDDSVAKEATDIVAHEAWRIEDKFSRYLPHNIVDEINNSDGGTVRVDSETADLIDFAASLFELSDCRFDITSGVLRKVWNFDGGEQLPDEADVRSALEQVGWNKVKWQRPELTLCRDMQIDFGGVGKEYAVDKAAGLLGEFFVGACLLNFGGDLVATAPPHESDGWQVGIEAFDADTGRAKRLIYLKNGALATSGDARRFIQRDDVRYGHILDPTTGWPVVSAPRSITIAADTCTQAGMLATLAMLNGAQAEEFLQQQECQYWCFR